MNLFTLRTWRNAMTALLLACPAAATTAAADGVTVSPPTGDDICLFSSLDLTKVTCFDDNGRTFARPDLTTLGNTIVLRDTTYLTGVGTHAPSKAIIKVNGATRFRARLGVDDEAKSDAGHGIVDYTVSVVKGDEEVTVMSGTIRRTDDKTVGIDVDLTDCTYLILNLENGEQTWADQVSWAQAYFNYTDVAPVTADYVLDSKTEEIPTAPEGLEHIPLSSLDISKATCGWGTIKADKSIDNNAITLRDTTYVSGVGTHSPSQIIVKLNGSVTRFYTRVGVDDEVISSAQNNSTQGRCDYHVYLKGEGGAVKTLGQGSISALDKETPVIDADVSGWKYLFLEISNGADGQNGNDHADWANAYLVFQDQNSTRPEIISADQISNGLATATTVFSQPGVRFMHKVWPTNPDATVTVSGLPDGLKWNAERRIVEGIVNQEGHYTYTAHVTADGETIDEPISFDVSSELQHPIPFMGWLSWNSVQSDVSESIVRQVADLFEKTGLYELGWNTIMMDDWWHANNRAADGKPLPNASRFPNGLKPVADYVHGKGMKFGLYTDAAANTCAGAFGSYGYETIDANQYAEWGIDIVKCDYCNAPADVETAKARYKALGDAFKESGRNILLYICEWGVREPWKWGAEVGGACWRISQDVRDCWIGSGTGVGVIQSIAAMKNLSAYQGVNRFNDADMLCTGLHGTGKSSNDLCQTGPGMTQDEYRTQFALWCMWSSPMALSFDPRSGSVTDDDMAIISNKEMIALNQDRMGQQADLISETADLIVFAKDLENGDVAVSVTNLSSAAQTAVINFADIPALSDTARYTCRDVQLQEAMADVTGSITTNVRSHATQVFRLARKYGGTTGITSPLSHAGFSIEGRKGSVVVTAPGTEGRAKRIIVSNTEGRVVAAATTTATRAELPVSAPKGVYIANVTCDAQATIKKVTL